MTLHVAQVVLPMFTGIPTDVMVNRFHFQVAGVTSAVAANAITNRLKAFYDGVYGATSSVRVNYIDWQLAQVKVFNLSDTPPRVPEVRSMGYSTAGTATTTLPTEVAAVLSFHAAPESGVRFQRLYNRVYLGGLTHTMMVASASDAFPTFQGTFITAVQNAALALRAANTVEVFWRQVSNAGGVTVDRNIVGGWVDNSPDTQRRRSVLASSRNPWTVP